MPGIYQPMKERPDYYWDETAGLKDDLPFYVKLVDSENRRQAMPGKCPSVFAVRVGYTVPFQWTSQQIFWHVIPADIELRENQLIFVPMPKYGEVKKIRPEELPKEEDKEEKRQTAKPKPKEPEAEAPLEKGKPTYVVQYLPLPLGNKTRPPVKLGVTFLTQHHNHRLVWDVMPTSEILASGMLFLDSYEDETKIYEPETEEKTHSRLRKLIGR